MYMYRIIGSYWKLLKVFFWVNVYNLQFFEICISLKSDVIFLKLMLLEFGECFRVPFRVFLQ